MLQHPKKFLDHIFDEERNEARLLRTSEGQQPLRNIRTTMDRTLTDLNILVEFLFSNGGLEKSKTPKDDPRTLLKSCAIPPAN